MINGIHKQGASRNGGGSFELLIRSSFFFKGFWGVWIPNKASVYPKMDFLEMCFPCEDLWDYLGEMPSIHARTRAIRVPTLFLYFNDSHKIPNVKTSESPSKESISTGGFPPIASSHCTSLPHFTTAVWLFQNWAKVHTRAHRARDW